MLFKLPECNLLHVSADCSTLAQFAWQLSDLIFVAQGAVRTIQALWLYAVADLFLQEALPTMHQQIQTASAEQLNIFSESMKMLQCMLSLLQLSLCRLMYLANQLHAWCRIMNTTSLACMPCSRRLGIKLS